MLSKILKGITELPGREDLDLIVDSDRVLIARNGVIDTEVKLSRMMRSIDVKATLRAFKMKDESVICFPAKSIASLKEVKVAISEELKDTVNTTMSNEAILLTRRIVYIKKEQIEQLEVGERDKHDFHRCIADTRDSLVLAYMFFKDYSRAVHSNFTNMLTDLDRNRKASLKLLSQNTLGIDFSDLGLVATALDLKENERYYQIYKHNRYPQSMLRLPENTISIIDDNVHGVITSIVENVKRDPWILYINTDDGQPVTAYDTANVVRVSPNSIMVDIDTNKEEVSRKMLMSAIKSNKYMKWDYILVDDLDIDMDILTSAPIILCKPNLNLREYQGNETLNKALETRDPGIVYSDEKWGFMTPGLKNLQLGTMIAEFGSARVSVADVVDYTILKSSHVLITNTEVKAFLADKELSVEQLLGEMPGLKTIVDKTLKLPVLAPYRNKYSSNSDTTIMVKENENGDITISYNSMSKGETLVMEVKGREIDTPIFDKLNEQYYGEVVLILKAIKQDTSVVFRNKDIMVISNCRNVIVL